MTRTLKDSPYGSNNRIMWTDVHRVSLYNIYRGNNAVCFSMDKQIYSRGTVFVEVMVCRYSRCKCAHFQIVFVAEFCQLPIIGVESLAGRVGIYVAGPYGYTVAILGHHTRHFIQNFIVVGGSCALGWHIRLDEDDGGWSSLLLRIADNL